MTIYTSISEGDAVLCERLELNVEHHRGGWVVASGQRITQGFLADAEQIPLQRQRRGPLHTQQQHLIVIPTPSARLASRGQQERELGDATVVGLPAVMGDHNGTVVVQRLDRPDPDRYEMSVSSLREPLSELHIFTCLWHTLLAEYCPVHSQEPDCLYDSQELLSWVNQINRLVEGLANPEEALYIERLSPHHFYYKTQDGSVSVARSRPVVEFLDIITKYRDLSAWRALDGVGGQLQVNGDLHNCVPWADLAKARSVLRDLGENVSIPTSVLAVPLENSLICASVEHIISIESASGRSAFEQEREAVLHRHQQEAEILFPPRSFHWSDEIDDRRFEDLTRDLLSAEPGFNYVRSVGPARERDGGRDLPVDAQTMGLPRQDWSVRHQNIRQVRIIVQCRATRRTVGRTDPSEIRDVIEDAGAQGFLLVTSSRVGASLVDRLESIRNRNGYWTDWWDRSELEKRLSRNPDILARYPDILRPFVESGDEG